MTWAGICIVGLMPFAFTHESYAVLVVGNAALAVAAAALAVGLDYAAPDWLRRCLSVRMVVAVGVLSYGIYLWHGPLMRIADDAGYSGRGWRSVAVLVSVLLAGMSHRYIEVPIRSWARRRSDRFGNAPASPRPTREAASVDGPSAP
jgi:peptidoglycan/LPS O-acetylase OafA/YrhL